MIPPVEELGRSLQLVGPVIGPLTPDLVEEAAALHEAENQRPAHRETLRRCIAEYPSAVAVDHGRVVGFVYSDRFAPDLLVLNNLLVAAAYRGQGVGARLLEYVEKTAGPPWRSILLSNSELWPHPPRRSPLEFYRKRGYREIWTTQSTTVMVKDLGA
ncbi:MAG: GNAT family N-acetyltransferase [Acidobacteriota bacterium]|nr:GNAT family N-acetyltransferase [Acidobacteriota bacterium]